MKLKPVIKKTLNKVETQKPSTTPKKANKQENKLPSDEYKPMFEPMRLLVRETPSNKDCTKMVKQYLEISVKRYDGDYVNQPMVYVQMYQESDFYTGYLKGKTIYLPLEFLYDFIDSLGEISDECEKRKIC